MYTLNKPEIPTPFSGEFLFDQGGARIKITQDLIGPDCKSIDLKVIAVSDGKMPSEIVFKRFEVREGVPVVPIQQQEEMIERAGFRRDSEKANEMAATLKMFEGQGDGSSSV